MATVLWFRRDLRRHDNPALLAAAQTSAAADGEVVPLFVVDPVLWDPAGPVRRACLAAALRGLDAALDGRLLVLHGDPRLVVPEVALAAGAREVHVAEDAGPYGRRRDQEVEAGLAADEVTLVRTGSPYAVTPGRVRKDDGTPYRVFTPFHRAWLRHGWRPPAADPAAAPRWVQPLPGDPLPLVEPPPGLLLPELTEAAALARWDTFRHEGLSSYADLRNRPDLEATSGLSADLRWGLLHPRTLLADLDDSAEHQAFARQLAWREFYADVLLHHPGSARANLDARFDAMRVDSGTPSHARLRAWQDGRTGYPFVDAGMRQLRGEGWMHNRVRMVVASFLVKDLHLWWGDGARWFMQWLRDGDLASNAHGWQWTAGTGTDASPYYRVFNPVGQGQRFDPEGDYVRRWVPELAHLSGPGVHEPWLAPDGYAHGYPERLVDHSTERAESLARLAEL